jgi:hypothetical protein
MLRSVASKVAWVGRTASTVFGLALVLALVVGVAGAAFGANGQAWILGQNNVATAITRLAGAAGVNGPMLQLINNNAGANDTALDLRVQAGEPPLRVNSDQVVTNLNADKLDGQEANAFLGASQKAADADLLDGKDSTQFAPHILFARVFSDGSLDTANSSHADSSFRSNTGVYIVNFDRNIGSESCVAIAEPQVQALTATFEGTAGGRASDEVIVHLYDSFVNDTNKFVDGGFMVAVFCR